MATDVASIGRRIRRYRKEKGLTLAELASKAKVSKSYLSELENGAGNHKRPSAETLYRIGKALGVAMSDLLGRPLIIEPKTTKPASLLEFAKKRKLPVSDIEMLASIQFRGNAPKTPERWEFIYQAIRNSAAIDG
jgi:transcriptional regulator with XRE-family HTH domain